MVDTLSPPTPACDPGQLLKQQHKLKALLEQAQNAEKVRNLYDHVVDVMDFLVLNYPHQALLKFEEVSYLIKAGDVDKLQAFLTTQRNLNYARHDAKAAQATKPYLDRAAAFFEVTPPL